MRKETTGEFVDLSLVLHIGLTKIVGFIGLLPENLKLAYII